MTVSLIKIRSLSKLFLVLAVTALLPCAAWAAKVVRSSTELNLDARYGRPFDGHESLDLHRYDLQIGTVEQRGEYLFKGDVRLRADAVHPIPAQAHNSGEVTIRDFYVQYKSMPWLVQVGNQQAVWGETFGFYYADIVNPKDYRDFGLMDLEYQRIPVPMLNIKHVRKSGAFQFLLIPQPRFNKLPAPGSDFYPALGTIPLSSISIADDNPLPFAVKNMDVGFRFTSQIKGYDLSWFYLNYLDRMPYYTMALQLNPFAVRLTPFHKRIHSLGFTGTADLSTFLVRWETVWTPSRTFSAFLNNSYVNAEAGELTYVLGADYTRLGNWASGLQFSQTLHGAGFPEGGLSAKTQTLLALHATGPVWGQQTLETTLSYMFSDGGWIGQLKYWLPQSKVLEIGLGADFLQGSAASAFGQYSRASRAIAQVRIRLSN